MSRNAIFMLLAVWLFCVPLDVAGADRLEVKTTRVAEISDLPLVDWVYNIDFAGEYVGVVEKDKSSFQLRRSDGSVVFSREAEKGTWFGSIKVYCPEGPLVVSHARGEDNISYSAYTVSGEVIFEDLLANYCELRCSPSGNYFYKSNNFMGGGREKPAIYDRSGSLLASPTIHTHRWELICDSDSTIIFMHDDRVMKLSVPEMVVLAEVKINPFGPPSVFHTSISPCHSYFAYSEYGKVTVCDFESGLARQINLDPIGPVNVNWDVVLSPGGEYVIAYETVVTGAVLNLFKKTDEGYQPAVKNYVTPVEKRHYTCGGFFFNGNVCALSFLNDHPLLQFETFVIDCDKLTKGSESYILLDGLVTEDSTDQQQFRIYRLNRESAGHLEIRTMDGPKVTGE
ncbi:MAG: hypothetical protein ABII79_03080 [bacterium]